MLHDRNALLVKAKESNRSVTIAVQYAQAFDQDQILAPHEKRLAEQAEKDAIKEKKAQERQKKNEERQAKAEAKKRSRDDASCKAPNCTNYYGNPKTRKLDTGYFWCDFCEAYGMCPVCLEGDRDENPNWALLDTHEAECQPPATDESPTKKRRIDDASNSAD